MRVDPRPGGCHARRPDPPADAPRYRTIRARAYVNDLDAQFALQSGVTRRALRRFDAESIPAPPSAAPTED